MAVEYDEQGFARRVPHRLKVRIPSGVVDGQKLRVPGKGGKGQRGGRDGDLYLDISVDSHPLYRTEGLDLHMDLPLAPWEAVLGTSVQMPTPAGTVSLKVPAGTRAGQKLRLGGRGLKRPGGAAGDFYANVVIAVWRPAGVKNFKLALFEDQDFSASRYDLDFPLVVRAGLNEGWHPLVLPDVRLRV